MWRSMNRDYSPDYFFLCDLIQVILTGRQFLWNRRCEGPESKGIGTSATLTGRRVGTPCYIREGRGDTVTREEEAAGGTHCECRFNWVRRPS